MASPNNPPITSSVTGATTTTSNTSNPRRSPPYRTESPPTKSSSSTSSSSRSASKRLLQELSQLRSEQQQQQRRQFENDSSQRPSQQQQTPSSSIQQTEPSPIERLGPVSDDDLFHWEAVIVGKGLGGGYDSGRWLLDIRVPDGRGGNGGSGGGGGGSSYPIVPPVVRFVTRICAANVGFETGEICLDLLKTAWTPAYTLKMTIEAIWQMLAAPGIDSPLNVDIAALVRQGDRVGSESLVRWGCAEWRWDGR